MFIVFGSVCKTFCRSRMCPLRRAQSRGSCGSVTQPGHPWVTSTGTDTDGQPRRLLRAPLLLRSSLEAQPTSPRPPPCHRGPALRDSFRAASACWLLGRQQPLVREAVRRPQEAGGSRRRADRDPWAPAQCQVYRKRQTIPPAALTVLGGTSGPSRKQRGSRDREVWRGRPWGGAGSGRRAAWARTRVRFLWPPQRVTERVRSHCSGRKRSIWASAGGSFGGSEGEFVPGPLLTSGGVWQSLVLPGLRGRPSSLPPFICTWPSPVSFVSLMRLVIGCWACPESA